MKVLQVIPVFKLAGAEIMCENLCVALQQQGVDVVAVSLYTKKTAITERLEKAHIKVVYLNKKAGPDPRIMIRLIKLFRREKPDAVHTHLYAGKYVVPAALLAGVPKIIYTVHNVAEKESSAIGKKLNRLFFRIPKVTPVALSGIVKKTVVDLYHLSDDKVPVVLNGVPLGKCIRKTNYEWEKQFSILHVGRMSAQKNHLEMIKAIALLVKEGMPVHLTLIGDGELRDDVQKKIKEYALEHTITWIPQTDNVYPYLHDADAFLLPSNYEGIPMSIIEAMGTGLPIIASAVGGVPDMLEDGYSGLLCTPHAENIAEHIRRMINDTALRQKCGTNALQRAKAFSAEIMAVNYIKIYSQSNS